MTTARTAACASVAAVAAGDMLGCTQVFVGLLSGWSPCWRHPWPGPEATSKRLRANSPTAWSNWRPATGLTGCLNHRTFYQQRVDRAGPRRASRPWRLAARDRRRRLQVDQRHQRSPGWRRGTAQHRLCRQPSRSHDRRRSSHRGDEFAVLLVETARAQAESVVDRFREAVGELHGPVPVSVTVGIAHLERPTADAPQQLVAESAARLYELQRRLSRSPRPKPPSPDAPGALARRAARASHGTLAAEASAASN